MEETKKKPADLTRRLTAFVVDCSLVHALRTLILQFYVIYFVANDFKELLKNFKEKFGTEIIISKIEPDQRIFILESPFFQKAIFCILISFALSFFYNYFFLSRKKSATLGYRLVGIEVVSDDGKLQWYQTLSRSFLAIFPLYAAVLVFFYQILAVGGLFKLIPTPIILFILFFGFVSWYDIFFLKKGKKIGHDYLTRTSVVLSRKEGEEGIIDSIFNSINSVGPKIKNTFKDMKDITIEKVKKFKDLKKEIKEKKEEIKEKKKEKSKKK